MGAQTDRQPKTISMDERRRLYAHLVYQCVRGLTPKGGGCRYSGSQIAYAKGRAGQRFLALERQGFPPAALPAIPFSVCAACHRPVPARQGYCKHCERGVTAESA